MIKCKHTPAAGTGRVLTFLTVFFLFPCWLRRLHFNQKLSFSPSTFQSHFPFLLLRLGCPLVSIFPPLNCITKRLPPPCLLFQSSREIWRALSLAFMLLPAYGESVYDVQCLWWSISVSIELTAFDFWNLEQYHLSLIVMNCFNELPFRNDKTNELSNHLSQFNFFMQFPIHSPTHPSCHFTSHKSLITHL